MTHNFAIGLFLGMLIGFAACLFALAVWGAYDEQNSHTNTE